MSRSTPAEDARSLSRDLSQRVRGEVRFDAGTRALYATTGSNYRQVPIGVVLPLDVDDVIAAVDVCRQHGAPVLPRGGGTSLAGQCVNVAVVIDTSKYMNRILEVDAERRTARVQPGVVLDDLQRRAQPLHLTFGPDPSTHAQCTLGGMIGNNSCGVHSVMAGKTDDNVVSLDILTYDGVRMRLDARAPMRSSDAHCERERQIYRDLEGLRDKYADEIRAGFPRIPRPVSGYNLPALLPENGFDIARSLVGSEGTCVMILEATTRLVGSPPCRSLLVLGYADVFKAADDVPNVLAYEPLGLEGMDDLLVSDIRSAGLFPRGASLLPHGRGWLLIEFGGETPEEAAAKAREAAAGAERRPNAPTSRIVDDPAAQHQIWTIRESALGATAHVSSQRPTWEGWEDAAVHPERLGAYLRGFRALLDRYGYHGDLYGHFGGGCVHTRIDFDFRTAEGIATYRQFIEDAADLVVRHGGSLSGEHGDGQSRAEMLPKMFSPALMEAFEAFKHIWDPAGRMNPGKLVKPYRIDEHLRLGPDYHPLPVSTTFTYPADNGSFADAALRCVGVGLCRSTEHGTMCPSYMATREEKHSTRGRARLLFEMLQGNPVTGGWKSREVKDALDLCLACKACKGECPVQVDMATYKAEFLSHYYEGQWRPRFAYATGLIHRWARLASFAPRFANLVGQTRGLSGVAKAIAGISPRRRLPIFASATFRDAFSARKRPATGTAPVLLWPDTFNNYFHPEIAQAAAEVLEWCGCRVQIPKRPLCCGRPLYDHGMLDLAKAQLTTIIETLRPSIQAGVPVVVLEPSCLSVFRDELPNLLPRDEDARRLSTQVLSFAEFLRNRGRARRLPRLGGRAIVHGHCHQKALGNMDADLAVLGEIDVDHELLDSGCCGMAGAFGFHRDHYEVAMAVGERVLLPAVRAESTETLFVADGFSCREQIVQGTGRRALHLAEVVRRAL